MAAVAFVCAWCLSTSPCGEGNMIKYWVDSLTGLKPMLTRSSLSGHTRGHFWWWLTWCSLLRQTKSFHNFCHTKNGYDPPLWFNFNWGVRIHQTTQQYRFTAIKDTHTRWFDQRPSILCFFFQLRIEMFYEPKLDDFELKTFDLKHVIIYTVYY